MDGEGGGKDDLKSLFLSIPLDFYPKKSLMHPHSYCWCATQNADKLFGEILTSSDLNISIVFSTAANLIFQSALLKSCMKIIFM